LSRYGVHESDFILYEIDSRIKINGWIPYRLLVEAVNWYCEIDSTRAIITELKKRAPYSN